MIVKYGSDIDRLAIAQGSYFTLTGLWPLLHMRSFEAVTGPKTDKWLVRTVGVLVMAIGGVLLRSAARGVASRDATLLAAGSAAGLAGIDLVYGGTGRISRVYLLDGLAELAFVGAWLVRQRR